MFAPHLGGPCYRCMLPQPPDPGTVPSCAEAGVLGVLPGIIGSLQAMEAIKLLLGAGEPPLGRLLHYDALQTKFREFNLRRDPECPLCGDHPSVTELIDYQEFCGIPKQKTSASTNQPSRPLEICVNTLKEKLDNGFEGLLIDVREPWEHQTSNIEGFRLVPMRSFTSILPELKEAGHDCEIILLCHSGARSAHVQQYLMSEGFTNTCNVSNGIAAWLRMNP